jgi:serine/threonine-protein kinase
VAGVGLAAILLGAGAGVVWMRQGDSGPTPRAGSGTTSTKGPTVLTPTVTPTPPPREEPKVDAGSPRVVATRPPDPPPEAPPETATQPSTQVKPPAQPETPESPQPVTASPQQKDPKGVVKTRPTTSTRVKGPPGSLQIVLGCWFEVYVDNVHVGRRPPLGDLSLQPGVYVISLRDNPGMKCQTRKVTIRSGVRSEITVPCEKVEVQ